MPCACRGLDNGSSPGDRRTAAAGEAAAAAEAAKYMLTLFLESVETAIAEGTLQVISASYSNSLSGLPG